MPASSAARERVREAIVELGALRVQHGVRAIEDPAVVALARDRGVTFDGSVRSAMCGQA